MAKAGSFAPKVAATIAPEIAKKGAFDRPLDQGAQHKAVKKLNARLGLLQLGWRAREVQKWNGRSMREVNEYVGIKRTTRRVDLHREMLKQRREADPLSGHSFLQR